MKPLLTPEPNTQTKQDMVLMAGNGKPIAVTPRGGLAISLQGVGLNGVFQISVGDTLVLDQNGIGLFIGSSLGGAGALPPGHRPPRPF